MYIIRYLTFHFFKQEREPMSKSMQLWCRGIFTDWFIFMYTFSFLKERQLLSSDAVTSIGFLWLVMAPPRESFKGNSI